MTKTTGCYKPAGRKGTLVPTFLVYFGESSGYQNGHGETCEMPTRDTIKSMSASGLNGKVRPLSLSCLIVVHLVESGHLSDYNLSASVH